MKRLLLCLFFMSTSALAIDQSKIIPPTVIPFVVKSEDIYSNPIPFFYQPSRIIYCKKCSPETIEQLKMWEELSTKDWAIDFEKNARSGNAVNPAVRNK